MKSHSPSMLSTRRRSSEGGSSLPSSQSSSSMLWLHLHLPSSWQLLLIGLVLTVNMHFILLYALPSQHDNPGAPQYYTTNGEPSSLFLRSSNKNHAFTTVQDDDSSKSSSLEQSEGKSPIPELSACLIVMDDNHFLIGKLFAHDFC